MDYGPLTKVFGINEYEKYI